MLLQDLQPSTGFAEDVRVLRALRNIFDALRAPREDLPESMPPTPGVSTTSSLALANGMWSQYQGSLPISAYHLSRPS